jgi:hypothetical protein
MNLGEIGSYGKTEFKTTMSDYNPGTKITLAFHDIPMDKDVLLQMLKDSVRIEDYEKACVIRDVINSNKLKKAPSRPNIF